MQESEDWQAQVEELVALQSIYSDSHFRLLNHISAPALGGSDAGASSSSSSQPAAPADEEVLQAMLSQPRPQGLVQLEVEVLAEVTLPADGLQLVLGRGAHTDPGGLSTSAACSSRNGSGDSEGMPVGEPVRWLPPLRAIFQLPVGYPSSRPPCLTMQAGWLQAEQLHALEQGLASVWEQQGEGFPVLFAYLDWLRECCLTHLGVSKWLKLCSSSGHVCGGAHAVSTSAHVNGEDISSSSGEGAESGDVVQDGPCKSVSKGGSLSAANSTAAHATGSPEHEIVEASGVEGCKHGSGGSGEDGGASTSAGGVKLTASNGGCSSSGGSSASLHGVDGCEVVAPSAEQLAMQLLRYHASKEQEEFESAQQRCSVCFEEVLGGSCLRLPSCHHHFCRACLQQMCCTNVKEGTLEALRCPDPSCRLPLPPQLLQALLSQDEYERWETLLLQRTLDRMQDLVYCPRCECPCIEDPDHFAQCSSCLYVFCSMCDASWHPGTQCMDEEQRLALMERRAKGHGRKKDARRAELDLMQQLSSLKLLQQTSKPCPGCKFATQKTEGCNKMTCAYCGCFWCWRCEVTILGYDHFKEGTCVLFEQEEIDRWNARYAAERAEEQRQGGADHVHQAMLGAMGVQRARISHCPTCGQANFHNRNNLVHCWACATHYCAACRKALRGKIGQHFLGSGCKQHA